MECIKIKGDKVPAFTCDAADPELAGCNDREKKYIAKKSSLSAEKIDKEINRLTKMAAKKMKESIKNENESEQKPNVERKMRLPNDGIAMK